MFVNDDKNLYLPPKYDKIKPGNIMSKLIAEYLQHPLSASANIALLDDGNVGGVLGATLGSKLDYPAGGSDGDALIKDGAAAVWGPGGGTVFLQTITADAVSTVSTDNLFSTDYEAYLFAGEISGSSTAAGTFFQCRYRVSGSDNTSSSYGHNRLEVAASASVARAVTNLHNLFDYGGGGSAAVCFIVHYPAHGRRTRITNFSGISATGQYQVLTSGSFDATTLFDGITFFQSTGTLTSKFNVYGLVK